MIQFGYFSGKITGITDFHTEDEQIAGCKKIMRVADRNKNIVNFIVTPQTYFVDHATMKTGDSVTGFYNTAAPALLIYPPQYEAIVMAKTTRPGNIKVDYFDSELVSSDGALKLNIAPTTRIILENDQAFTARPANHYLIATYGTTTRSIPAQTTPYKVIVMCKLS